MTESDDNRPKPICKYYIDNALYKQNERLEKARKVSSRWLMAQTVTIILSVIVFGVKISSNLASVTATVQLLSVGKSLSDVDSKEDTSCLNRNNLTRLD